MLFRSIVEDNDFEEEEEETPVRGHKFYYEVPSAYYWHSLKKRSKDAVKFCIGWKYWKHLVKE